MSNDLEPKFGTLLMETNEHKELHFQNDCEESCEHDTCNSRGFYFTKEQFQQEAERLIRLGFEAGREITSVDYGGDIEFGFDDAEDFLKWLKK